MAGLGVPWWLIALAVIPLIRWLHRWQAPLSDRPVSAIFLWDTAASIGTGGETRHTPDAAWRRRALLAGLLVMALAEPWWQRDGGLVSVWIDDSLSMSATEQGVSRLANALLVLDQALQDSGARRVSLRSLSDPARAMQGDDPRAFDASTWLATSQGNPRPLPAALLSPNVAHWLVTDGANEHLVQWAKNAPLARVITVGDATENVAVTRLAARPSLETPGSAHVLMGVSNQGNSEARRELHLRSGSSNIETRQLTLRAGETQYLTTTHNLAGDGLMASLSPGDAVPLDDSLALAPSSVARVPVLLDTICPVELSLAIRSHPQLLSVAAGETAKLQVSCSNEPTLAQAVLRLHTSDPKPATAPLDWQPGAGRLRELHLPLQWISVAAWDAALDGDYETLLATDEKPLLIRRTGPTTVIETVLDMSRPTFSSQPEYAAVVAGLIDLALDRPLLDGTAISMIEPSASRIAPSDLHVRDYAGYSHGVIRHTLSNAFLALAVLVLLADMLLLWRARREASRA